MSSSSFEFSYQSHTFIPWERGRCFLAVSSDGKLHNSIQFTELLWFYIGLAGRQLHVLNYTLSLWTNSCSFSSLQVVESLWRNTLFLQDSNRISSTLMMIIFSSCRVINLFPSFLVFLQVSLSFCNFVQELCFKLKKFSANFVVLPLNLFLQIYSWPSLLA